MKRLCFVALAAMLAAAGCASSTEGATGEGRSPSANRPVLLSEPMPSTVPETTSTVATTTGQAEELLASLTLEEKIGQLFMPVISGRDATSVTSQEGQENEQVFGFGTPAEIVSRYKLGGVIYLHQNIVSADQVGSLSDGLQAAALQETGIGLLVAVDQEGGRVTRITDGVTIFPSASLLSGDVEAVREAGYLTGRQVAVQGINVVLAPVADIAAAGTDGAIGSRSYGENPAVVADMVSAAVGGLQDSGVAAAVKHWPGHGATQVDSHVQLPVLDITRSVWESRERLPFQAAVDEDVAIVLVGHLALPSMDTSGGPATVSSVLIDDLLRRDLGFEGVVMTDALNMGAVSDLDRGEVVVQAVAAGADVLLVPPDLKVAFEAMTAAVESGRLPQERIDQAVLRVLRLKQRLGLLPAAP